MPKTKQWEKLDNTAKLFPVIATENMSGTYRICAVLKEDIVEELLQESLDIVLPKFPGFNRSLRTGIFWYYLEENGRKAPRVIEENTYPCRFIHPKHNNGYLFRVTYYKNRINLEVFHVLADGTGGIGFLKELVYQYLRLSHSELMDSVKDSLAEGTSLDLEDSFLRNYRVGNASPYKRKRAFTVRGEKLDYNGYGVNHGYMSVSELKKVAKEKYGCSINQYLIACYAWGIFLSNPSKISESRAIRVAVPVNLRPFYGSNTTKNFFVMVSAEFIPKVGFNSFSDCLNAIKESLKKQVTKENLEKILSYNVKNETILLQRAFPLPLKNLAMWLVYRTNALANTSTVTNIGNIEVDAEYKEYIRSFFCLLSFSIGQEIKATITSYEDELNFTIVSTFRDTIIQRGVFSQIASDGIQVTVETNGVYNEEM